MEPAVAGLLVRKPRSLWLDAWERLLRNRAAVAGMCVIGLFYGVAILAPLLAPHGVNEQRHEAAYRLPAWASGDWRFVLGTDAVGRDVLTRLIYGARISMTVGLVPISISLLIGGAVGLTAGYMGGRTDNLLMRLVDAVYAFPDLLFLIIISIAFRDTWLGQQMGGLLLIFLALAVVGWEGLARLVRGQVLSLRQKEFVEAARCIGGGHFRIMWRHLMPNVLAPVIVALAFRVPGAIMAEATLSFFGIGIRSPTPSWGTMLQDGLAALFSQPALVLAPAAVIGMLLISFTFLGDGLRDALDPRLKT